MLVSVFTRAGETVLFEIGPFDATVEGVEFAAQTLVRLFAISASIGLFVLTTDPRAFVLDLERRGLSSRFAFVAAATIEAVPTLVERAAHQELKGILDYTRDPNVSADFNHDPHSSNFAMDQTKVMDGNLVRVLAWYDNEWGFSNRMCDTAVAMGKQL